MDTKDKKTKKHPGGRPAKYKQEYAELAHKACSVFGADDTKLAEFFNVCKKTINIWKHEHSEFLHSIKNGKDEHDTKKVEVSFLERALGYSHPEIKYFSHEGVVTDEREVIKHYPPETTAAIFWLKNRNPKRWKDIKAVEHSGPDKKPISIKLIDEMGEMSDEELLEMVGDGDKTT